MKINGKSSSCIECMGSSIWISSYVYADSDFEDVVKIVPNQSKYVIEFQFAPQVSMNMALVKDINVLLEVMDGLHSLP